MNKILIIIPSKNHINKLLPQIEKLKKNKINKITVVAWNNDVEKKLKGKNITCKTIDHFINPKELKDVNKKGFSWIKEWSSINIEDKKNFKELITYQNFSLWWFVDFWFYYASAFNYYSIEEIIKNLDIIECIINKERPNKIIIIDDKKLISKILTILARYNKIQLSLIQDFISNLKYEILKLFFPFAVKSFKDIKSNLRELATKLTIFLKPIKHEKNKILMLTHPTYIQLTINPGTNERIKEDIIIGPIIRELKKDKNNPLTVVDTDPFPTFRIKFLFERKYRHIEGYLTNEIKKNISQKTREFSKKWERLKQEKNFIDSLTYKNIPIFELFEDKFSELFHRKFIEAIKYIEMMKEVVKTEKPDIIVIVDEYGLYGRAAIVVGKIYNLPTLAIQHAMIVPYLFGYYHSKHEISNTDIIEPIYCPLPDKTVVGGSYYRDILLKTGFYPFNSVVITGQPKYDVMAFADKIYKKENIFNQLKIEPNKKLIVFASQPDSPTANEFLFRSVFKAIKNIPDVQLVIKLHPNEYDKSLHLRIAREVGVNVIVVKNINLFELLYSCDLMMTVNSTVAVEAMILNKPVITVNLIFNPDAMPFADPGWMPFAESGAAMSVYKPEDIKPTIVRILKDQRARKKLESNMKKFVYNHAYRIDGSASKRIVGIINSMIRNKLKK